MPRLTVRAAQLAATALAFALASRASAVFSLPHGLSFFFPPAGISLAAGAAFGPWGVAGVVLGVIALPWGAADSIPALLLPLRHLVRQARTRSSTTLPEPLALALLRLPLLFLFLRLFLSRRARAESSAARA